MNMNAKCDRCGWYALCENKETFNYCIDLIGCKNRHSRDSKKSEDRIKELEARIELLENKTSSTAPIEEKMKCQIYWGDAVKHGCTLGNGHRGDHVFLNLIKLVHPSTNHEWKLTSEQWIKMRDEVDESPSKMNPNGLIQRLKELVADRELLGKQDHELNKFEGSSLNQANEFHWQASGISDAMDEVISYFKLNEKK